MKKALLSVLAVVSLVSIIGCATSPTAGVVLSGEQRNTSPNVATSDVTTLVNGNNEFSFDLFQALKQQQGDLFYSPYSISLALAMTYAGARNETETEMANVLHFTLPQDRLHLAFNWLDLALANQSEDVKDFQLHIVNALWGQKGYKFLDSFLNLLGQNYGAGLRLLDFVNQSEPSRVTINNWVSDQTKGKINDLIPQGSIDALTCLVLTNAIYFNASWLSPFDKGVTSDGTFHLIGGGNVTVPMMSQSHSFGYESGDGYQAVELPYNGSELSMVILLPDSGKFESFENELNASFASRIISDLEYREVDLTLPKFKYEYECSLADTLAAMGMPKAFSADADFSGMAGNRDLAISDVLHKAYVSVDETGTEAAAATAVIIGLTAIHGETVQMTVDRPFIFLIRDIDTGTILFIGQVMNPNSSKGTSQSQETLYQINLSASTFPHSMKGWELYSWSNSSEWHYSLLEGTNRLKSCNEVTSSEAIVTSIDSLEKALAKFPRGEDITWRGPSWLTECWNASFGNLSLPSNGIVDEIKQYCAEHDLTLNVAD